MSGSSAPMPLPAVWCTMASTVSSDEAKSTRGAAATVEAAGVDARVVAKAGVKVARCGVKLSRSVGTAPAAGSSRAQFSGVRASTEGESACRLICIASSPLTESMSPRPAAFMRVLIPAPAAMPTPPHGPHCSEAPAAPLERRKVASESRHELAAA